MKHNEIHDVGRKNVCVKNICGTKKKLTKKKNICLHCLFKTKIMLKLCLKNYLSGNQSYFLDSN